MTDQPPESVERERCGITSAQHGECWLPLNHPGDHEAQTSANRWPRVNRVQAREEGLVPAPESVSPSERAVEAAAKALYEWEGEQRLWKWSDADAVERDNARRHARAVIADYEAALSRPASPEPGAIECVWYRLAPLSDTDRDEMQRAMGAVSEQPIPGGVELWKRARDYYCKARAGKEGTTCDHCGKHALEPTHGEDGFALCPKCATELALACVEPPASPDREPWTGKRLFNAVLHEAEIARSPFDRLSRSGRSTWDALAARIESEIAPASPGTGAKLCEADEESLRAAQCADDEIAVHLAMHTEGRCPQASEHDLTEYQRRVAAARFSEGPDG